MMMPSSGYYILALSLARRWGAGKLMLFLFFLDPDLNLSRVLATTSHKDTTNHYQNSQRTPTSRHFAFEFLLVKNCPSTKLKI